LCLRKTPDAEEATLIELAHALDGRGVAEAKGQLAKVARTPCEAHGQLLMQKLRCEQQRALAEIPKSYYPCSFTI
jgi:hypothetical protein